MSDQQSVSVLLQQFQDQLQSMSSVVGQLAELAACAEKRGGVGREFLSERQMAEYLGISKRAIESRRSAGKYPPDVCIKIHGSWIYSLSRYEAWLESMWPLRPALALKNVPASRRRVPKGGHLLV